MLRRTMAATSLLLLVGILAASPGPSAAQTLAHAGEGSNLTPSPTATEDVELTDALQTRAEGFATARGTFLEAAVLYRESARQRPRGDSACDLPFLMAARLFTHAGYPEEGIAVLEEAAARSLEENRDLFAAQAYLEAGMIAQAHGNDVAAHENGRRALAVARSGALAADERNSIVRRVILEN